MAQISELERALAVDTGEHFLGRFEVERKFRCDDLKQVSDRLSALGAQPFMQNGDEEDAYLDLPGRALEANKQALVIRVMHPSERVLIIAKGPGPDECSSIETEGFDKTCKLFEKLGYEQIRYIKKSRDVYFLGKCHVTLDMLDGFGSFVEVAIMVEEEHELAAAAELVNSTVSALGLDTAQEVHQSYAQMIDEATKG